MFDELEIYEHNGHFFFKKGDNLRAQSKTVPNLPGVYLIFRLAHGRVDLVYIGKSGTVLQNGEFRNQLLRKRLNNKQGGVKRQEFFTQKMEEEEIDALDIYWYVTFDDEYQDLPGYVEGLLLQKYFDIHEKLPPWNREY